MNKEAKAELIALKKQLAEKPLHELMRLENYLRSFGLIQQANGLSRIIDKLYDWRHG